MRADDQEAPSPRARRALALLGVDVVAQAARVLRPLLLVDELLWRRVPKIWG